MLCVASLLGGTSMMGRGVRTGAPVSTGGTCMCVSFRSNSVGKTVSKGSGWHRPSPGHGSLGGTASCVWDHCEEASHSGPAASGSICCIYCGLSVLSKRMYSAEPPLLTLGSPVPPATSDPRPAPLATEPRDPEPPSSCLPSFRAPCHAHLWLGACRSSHFLRRRLTFQGGLLWSPHG